jgi:metallo-beta-lactamase family protein
MSKKAKVTFYGGAGAVTGSNFLFQTEEGSKVLIDCGLTQGNEELEKRNYQPFEYDPTTIDTLIITHAHLDHIGLIGKLVKEGFKGKIYSTEPTKALAEVMLEDALKIMKENHKRHNKPILYDGSHLTDAFNMWKVIDYHQSFSPAKGIEACLFDAGHILGSAMIRLGYGENSITFTGDLGNSPSPLLPDTEVVKESKYLVMEAVYGDRNHEDRENRREVLKEIILKAIKRGGPIIIPAFSLERTQGLLYEMNELIEEGKLPRIPVFLDSPLAVRILKVYELFPQYFKSSVQEDIKSGDDIFDFPGLTLTATNKESQGIKHTPDPKIIIAGAGMSHAGRVISHEHEYLSDPKSTLLLIGYQAPGTLGRQLVEGLKKVMIWGDTIKVRANIVSLLGYSSHKDANNLFEFAVESTKKGTQKIFVCLSEPGTAIKFAQRLQNEAGIKAYVPQVGEIVELDM